MIVQLSKKMDLFQQLESRINLSGYAPKQCDVPELTQNILDVYDVELIESDREYFTISDSQIDDIMEYVEMSGGFGMFDFTVE